MEKHLLQQNNNLNLFSGENELWKKLRKMNPEDIAKCSGAEIIKLKEGFKIRILNMEYMFYLNGETEPSMHPHLKFLTLLYLAECKDLCTTGKYQALHEIKGGQFFFRGSHELPLGRLAEKFGKDADAFYKKGVSLGGKKAPYGDMSVLLYPFPKIPLVYIFWKEDDEFPARITLLFDETAEKHLLLEGLWGTAFFTTNIFMQDMPPVAGKVK